MTARPSAAAATTTPNLIIVIGTAGSGKSTIARRLAYQYEAAYLDKDTMSARFVEAALVVAGYDPGDREANSFYRDSILPLEYESLLDVAGANLRLGRSVVLDAPFSPYLSDPTFITATAQRLAWPPADVEVVRVHVSPEILRTRLYRRGLRRDQVKLAHWDEYWALHGGLRCAWTGVRLSEISNDAPEASTPSPAPAPLSAPAPSPDIEGEGAVLEHSRRGLDESTR